MSITGYASDVLIDADRALDVDTTACEQSHIPGAVGWNWTSQLVDGIRRDIASREEFSKLLSESGIGPDATIVLYGNDDGSWTEWGSLVGVPIEKPAPVATGG